jgi:hypothetical protein
MIASTANRKRRSSSSSSTLSDSEDSEQKDHGRQLRQPRRQRLASLHPYRHSVSQREQGEPQEPLPAGMITRMSPDFWQPASSPASANADNERQLQMSVLIQSA